MNLLNLTDKVVRRTTNYGLTASKTSKEESYRWFLIWTAEISTGLVELYEYPSFDRRSKESLTSLGDVLWGITAVCQLLDIKSLEFSPRSGWSNPDPPLIQIIDSLKLLNYAKKACRDGPDHHDIDPRYVKEKLQEILKYTMMNYGTDSVKDAISYLEEKLTESKAQKQ
jgi:hypothetical protein